MCYNGKFRLICKILPFRGVISLKRLMKTAERQEVLYG